MSVLGVILAGGASRRMGERDKVLERIGGETLLERAVRRLSPQVERLVVNGPPALAAHCDVEVVPDTIEGRAGPLAGVLAAMETAQEDMVVTAAVDTPFFPHDLVTRLSGEGIAIAADGNRLHPVFAAWPVHLAPDLRTFLENGDRKIMLFAERHGYRTVAFEGADPFFNVNTPEELAAAREIAA